MKMTKRVLSLILTLAMLLTVATFPAMAEPAAQSEYVYEGKDVLLYASSNTRADYSGPAYLARPAEQIYVGDTIGLAPNQFINKTLLDKMNEKFPSSNLAGFIVSFWKTPGNSQTNDWGIVNNHKQSGWNWKLAVVGVDPTTGAMTGLYENFEALASKTPFTLTLEEGKWICTVLHLIGDDQVASPTTALYTTKTFTSQGNASLHNNNNPNRWTIDVKAAPTQAPLTSAPYPVYPGLATGVASIKTEMLTSGDFIGTEVTSAAVTENQAYILGTGGKSSEGVISYGTSLADTDYAATVKVAFGSAPKMVPDGFRFDFVNPAYIETVKFSGFDSANFVHSVYGSMDGDNWFPIDANEDNTLISTTGAISVGAIVKHLRVDIRDIYDENNSWWCTSTFNLADITGRLNVSLDGFDVTVQTPDGSISETVKADITTGLATIPEKFQTGNYKFYTDSEFTKEFDFATTVITENTVIYAKYSYSGNEIQLEPNSVWWDPSNTGLGSGGANIFVRPTNDVYVGDSLVLGKVEYAPIQNWTTDIVDFSALTYSEQKVVGYALLGNTRYMHAQNNAATNYTARLYGDIHYFAVTQDEITGKYYLEGFYKSLEDMKNNTGKVDFEITAEGAMGFSVCYVITEDADGNYVENKAISTDNTSGWNKNWNWFLDVQKAPTSEVEAQGYLKPAQLPGIANRATEMDLTTFANDPAADGFADATKKYYAPVVVLDGSSVSWTPYLRVENRTTTDALAMRIWQPGFRVDFAEETYIKTISLSADAGQHLIYDVFGATEEGKWYPISLNQKSTGSNHTINVDGIAKYFRIDIRATGWTNGAFDSGLVINNIVGCENVADGWTVTFKYNNNDYVFNTGIDGMIKLPENLQQALGTTEVRFELTDGNELNFKLPAMSDMTVNVVADTYKYEPKTVYIKLNDYVTDFTRYMNGALNMPEVSFYAGDKVTISPDLFKNSTITVDSVAYRVVGVKASFKKFETEPLEKSYITYDSTTNTFSEVTLSEGVYLMFTDEVYYLKDNVLTTHKPADNSQRWRNDVVVVKAAPTEAPANVATPSYSVTGDEEVTSLTVSDAVINFAEGYAGGEGLKPLKPNESVSIMTTAKFEYNEGIPYPADIKNIVFTLDNTYYVKTVSLVTSDLKEADVYGSTNGTEWYLLGDDVIATSVSGSTTFAVNGVAKFVELRFPEFSGWWLYDTGSPAATGFALDSGVDTTPTTGWVDASGNKTALTDKQITVTINGNPTQKDVVDLPVAYEKDGVGYTITGWKMATADGLVDMLMSDLQMMSVSELGDLYPEVTEIPVAIVKENLEREITGKGLDAGKFDATEFVNGIWLQGAQISTETNDQKSGLRFVNAVDNKLYKALTENKDISGVAKGVVMVTGTYYKGGDLKRDDLKTGYKDFACPKNWMLANDFGEEYFKFTARVTPIPSNSFAVEIYVRPYITFEYNGETVTLYGEQYNASTYEFAKYALMNDTTLSAELRAELQTMCDYVEKGVQ